MSVKKFLFLLHFQANDRLKMGGGLLAAAMGQTMLTHLVHKYLVKIAWHGPEEMSSSLATSLTINVQSALTKSCTSAVTSFLFDKGCL
jgi:hypothetical protein